MLFENPEDIHPTGSAQNKVSKVRTQNELLTLIYLSYLSQNNYLKANDEEYIFGELMQTINTQNSQF